ncbi:MAG TPA: hypothetical protein VJ577_03945, partial [Burkholderiaceae bacterium]|nr:hypothetical protein [Burkholderiaceae bacterium]
FAPCLHALSVPLLLFVGDRDQRLALVRRAADVIAGARLVVLPGQNHAVALAAGAALMPHIEAFLQTA